MGKDGFQGYFRNLQTIFGSIFAICKKGESEGTICSIGIQIRHDIMIGISIAIIKCVDMNYVAVAVNSRLNGIGDYLHNYTIDLDKKNLEHNEGETYAY